MMGKERIIEMFRDQVKGNILKQMEQMLIMTEREDIG